MKKIIILFSILILSVRGVVFSQVDFESKLLNQFHSIQSQEMMTWIEKLCSPEFNGRLAGTPEFIARKVKRVGYKTCRRQRQLFSMVRFSLYCCK